MSVVWSPEELRALIGTGTVFFVDRSRQPVPPPAWLGAGHEVGRRGIGLARVYDADRAALIIAYKQAMRRPGHVAEATARLRGRGDTWTSCRVRLLNLFDQPDTAAIVCVLEPGEVIPAPDAVQPSRVREVPWVRLWCDSGSTIIEVEGMVEELYGGIAADYLGLSVLDLIHPDDLERCLDVGFQAVASPGGELHFAHRIRRPDGTVRLVESTIRAVRRADGLWSVRHRDADRTLHNELLYALEAEQLVLAYQPLIEVGSGQVTGAEALVRWNHPTRGIVPPLDFIPNAEASGLIIELGAWVLRSACVEAATWPENLHVAVNLSTRQLTDGSIVATVADALEISGLKPARLVLEVTESALLEDPERAIGYLIDLKALGVGLAIDDFGTGYSSLLYLKRMPVDALKLDRTFVAGLGEDDGDAAIVSSVVSLAHAFGIQAIAEGVETEEQRRHLSALGCTLAQGYLWYRPLPPEQFHQAVTGSSPAPERHR
jgi:EAL domain-containing protein (putative c-di-GMP-specific phosphodiesterase class I)/PAS domain-containing protein